MATQHDPDDEPCAPPLDPEFFEFDRASFLLSPVHTTVTWNWYVCLKQFTKMTSVVNNSKNFYTKKSCLSDPLPFHRILTYNFVLHFLFFSRLPVWSSCIVARRRNAPLQAYLLCGYVFRFRLSEPWSIDEISSSQRYQYTSPSYRSLFLLWFLFVCFFFLRKRKRGYFLASASGMYFYLAVIICGLSWVCGRRTFDESVDIGGLHTSASHCSTICNAGSQCLTGWQKTPTDVVCWKNSLSYKEFVYQTVTYRPTIWTRH